MRSSLPDLLKSRQSQSEVQELRARMDFSPDIQALNERVGEVEQGQTDVVDYVTGGDPYNLIPANDNIKPAAPQNLVVTPAPFRELDAQWDPPPGGDYVAKSVMEITPSGGSAITVEGNSNFAFATGLTGGTLHSVRVMLVDQWGLESDWSNTVTATPLLTAAEAIDLTALEILGRLNGLLPNRNLATIQDATKLGAQLVQEAHIATAAVRAAQIADAAITTAKFAQGIAPVNVGSTLPTLPNAAYPAGAVFSLISGGTAKLYRSTGATWTAEVPTVDLTGQVVSNQITDGSIVNAKLAAGAVDALKLANLSVTTAKLADGAVDVLKLANLSVDVTKFASGLRPIYVGALLPTLPNAAYPAGDVFSLVSGSTYKLYRSTGTAWTAEVPTADLSGQLTSSQIGDSQILASKLALNSVALANMQANSVDAAQLLTSSVTNTKLAAGSVTTAKLVAGVITTNELGALAVTAAKIAAGTITANEIAVGTITGDRIAASTIVAGNIAAGSITTVKLAALSVTANELAANSVIAGKIAAGVITATELAAGAVIAGKIAAGVITALELAAGSITAEKLTIGSVSDNAVPNGSFEEAQSADATKPARWVVPYAYTTGSGAFSTAQKQSGSQSYGLTATTTTAYGAACAAIPVVEGDLWYLSTRHKASVATSGDGFYLRAVFGTTATFTGEASVLTLASNIASTSSWQTAEGQITVPAGMTYMRVELINSLPTTDCTIYVDDVVARKVTVTAVIADNAIVARNIAAQTITANEMAAGAITAEKLTIGSVSDNALPNGSFEEAQSSDATKPARWVAPYATYTTGSGAFSTAQVQSGTQSYGLTATATTSYGMASDVIPVVAGDLWYVSIRHKASVATSGDGLYVRAIFGTTAAFTGEATSVTPVNNAASTSTWQIADGQITVPAGVTYMRLEVMLINPNNACTVYIDNAAARKVTVTAVIADDAITAAKIAANSIAASHIVAGTITANEIAAATITGAKIAAGTLTATHLAADTITAGQIAAGAINTSELAAGAVNASKIAAGTITANELAANSVTATELAANSVTANVIAADAVLASAMATQDFVAINSWMQDAAIVSAKIASLTADKITAGTISAGTIALALSGKLTAGAGTTVSATGLSLSPTSLLDDSISAATYRISNSGATLHSSMHFFSETGNARGIVLRGHGDSANVRGNIDLHAIYDVAGTPYDTDGAYISLRSKQGGYGAQVILKPQLRIIADESGAGGGLVVEGGLTPNMADSEATHSDGSDFTFTHNFGSVPGSITGWLYVSGNRRALPYYAASSTPVYIYNITTTSFSVFNGYGSGITVTVGARAYK